MYDSLRSTLGPIGFKELLNEMSRNYKARLAAEEAATSRNSPGEENQAREEDLPSHIRAPFLATLDRLYSGTGGVGEWGFVVYRLAYGDDDDDDDDEGWAGFRERWDGLVDSRLDTYDAVPGLSAARSHLRFHWDEGSQLQGTSFVDVAARYRSLLTDARLPAGLAHAVCLVVTAQSMRSLLEYEISSSVPRAERKTIPFVIAVDRSLGEEPEGSESHGFSGSFNVALESLVDELFTVIGGDIQSPRELGTHLGDRQIWCSSAGRHRVFTQQE